MLMASQRSSGIGSGWSSPLGKRCCILVQRHNIHAYVPQHVRPPVDSGDELQGFEAAQVSSYFGVMAE